MKDLEYIMEILNKHDERIRGVEINIAHLTGKIIAGTAITQIIIGIIITLAVKYL